jgi:2-dehydro-3-deoxyphosphooctonate aldolase (KDO 8-P synthase)
MDDKTEDIASELSSIMSRFEVDFYFKASFDKANRTSLESYRGPGIESIYRLGNIRKKHDIKVTTDVHECWQVSAVASRVDMVQIPALLCRQTDLLAEAGKHSKAVNIKKGQFAAPWDMAHAVEKVRAQEGCRNITVTERGTTFGYNRLVVDMLSIRSIQEMAGVKVIFDCTHSLQLPAAGSGCSASQPRDYARTLALAATAAGCDGLFFEVYPDPDRAKCDGPNSIRLDSVASLLHDVLEVREAVNRRPKS